MKVLEDLEPNRIIIEVTREEYDKVSKIVCLRGNGEEE